MTKVLFTLNHGGVYLPRLQVLRVVALRPARPLKLGLEECIQMPLAFEDASILCLRKSLPPYLRLSARMLIYFLLLYSCFWLVAFNLAALASNAAFHLLLRLLF